MASNIKLTRAPADGYWSEIWLKKPWTFCYWSGRPTEDWMFSTAYSADAKWNDAYWKHDRFNELLIKARSEVKGFAAPRDVRRDAADRARRGRHHRAPVLRPGRRRDHEAQVQRAAHRPLPSSTASAPSSGGGSPERSGTGTANRGRGRMAPLQRRGTSHRSQPCTMGRAGTSRDHDKPCTMTLYGHGAHGIAAVRDERGHCATGSTRTRVTPSPPRPGLCREGRPSNALYGWRE